LDPYSSSSLGKYYQLTVPGPFQKNSSAKATGIPYLRSANSLVSSLYNYINCTTSTMSGNSSNLVLNIYLNYSYVA